MTAAHSSLSLHRKGKSVSLRTTVPIEIVKLLGVSNGNKLIWKYSIESNTMTFEKGER